MQAAINSVKTRITWTTTNGLQFSVFEVKVIHFTKQCVCFNNLPSFLISNSQLTAKFLDLIFDNKLTWSIHLDKPDSGWF